MGNALHTPGAPGVGLVSPAEARLDDVGLLAVGGGGLVSGRTGVMAGPGATAVVTGTSSTAPMRYQVAAHHWVTNRGSVSDGNYRGAAEAVKTVDTGAAPGSGSRIDVIWVKQQDSRSTLTADGTDGPLYGCTQGVSSTGTPAKPAIPLGAEELAVATVLSTATRTDTTGVTIANTAKLTTTRGGVLPIRTAAELAGLPAYPSAQALELDTGRLRWHDGTRWRYAGDRVVVTDTAGRDALGAYEGLVADVAGAAEYRYTSGAWIAYRLAPAVLGITGSFKNFDPAFQALRVWVEGRTGFLHGFLQTTATIGSTDITVATIPAGTTPKTGKGKGSSFLTIGTGVTRIDVNENGAVVVSTPGLPNGQLMAVNMSWPLD